MCCCLLVLVGGFPSLLLLLCFTSVTSGERNIPAIIPLEIWSSHVFRNILFFFFFLSSPPAFVSQHAFLGTWGKGSNGGMYNTPSEDQWEIVMFQQGSCKRNSLDLKRYLFLIVLKSSNFIRGPFKNTLLLSCICQADIFMWFLNMHL